MNRFYIYFLTLLLSIGGGITSNMDSHSTSSGGISMEQPIAPVKAPAVEQGYTQPPVPVQIYEYQPGFTAEFISDEVFARIYGLSYKENCTVPPDDLRYLKILYIDFNGETQNGEIICNKLIAEDFLEIFYELYQATYPIEKIRLIDEYNADDTVSITDNNTSCFNFRKVDS